MRAVSLALLLAPLLGCAEPEPLRACTALFAWIPVTVLQSPGGAPVTGLSISATNLRTEESFAVQQVGVGGAGTYTAFDDNLRDRIRASGDSVRVTGSTGAPQFMADLLIDVPGGCHVRKLAGPDTVTVP